MLITEKEIEAIKFFIKLANNYLMNHRDEKKTKEKLLFFHEVLEYKMILEVLIKELENDN